VPLVLIQGCFLYRSIDEPKYSSFCYYLRRGKVTQEGATYIPGVCKVGNAANGIARELKDFISSKTWTVVDRHFEDTLLEADPVLDSSLRASEAAGLPPYQVSPSQGKFLSLIAQIRGARRILEIGTLGGYSANWLARALPEAGRLVTLELDARCADVASENVRHAGLADRAEIRVGPALESLRMLAREGVEPFDLVFIDADKANNAAYFERALPLCRPAAVIIADNVVREGAVADSRSRDPDIVGTRRLLELTGKDKRISATAVQAVGEKGYDGFLIAVLHV
jgi:predicted O-methyltransferase YrrM